MKEKSQKKQIFLPKRWKITGNHFFFKHQKVKKINSF